MKFNSKVKEIKDLSKISPVLAIGIPTVMFGESTIIEADIPSKSLGVINTAKGIKAPSWFYDVIKCNESHQIIINGIDSIDKQDQEKFYELLKYKAISNIELPSDCNIILLATDISKVSETILRLCLLVK